MNEGIPSSPAKWRVTRSIKVVKRPDLESDDRYTVGIPIMEAIGTDHRCADPAIHQTWEPELLLEISGVVEANSAGDATAYFATVTNTAMAPLGKIECYESGASLIRNK